MSVGAEPLLAKPTSTRRLQDSHSEHLRRGSQLVWGIAFASPVLLGFILWKLVPVLASFVVALTDWNVARRAKWVGLENFQRMLFHDPLFWKSLGVTAVYAVAAVPTSLALAFTLALLLNAKAPGQRIFRTLFYLPSIMPTIAVSVLWLWILNPDLGLLNAMLDQIGAPHLQ
jgi:multiple sugar transport system permease protein